MILTGNQIRKEVEKGSITILPFTNQQITTNSYDLRLADELIYYLDDVLDPFIKPKYRTKKLTIDGIILNKGDFCLGASSEIIGSEKYVPIIHAKSSIARMGLFVHCTADLIDIGSRGVVTFQLYATLPVKIYPGMLLGQVSFWVPKGDIVLYNGKYQNSNGPQISKSWQDH